MANNGCTFCNISKGLAEGEILYQDDLVTAFRDIHPVSPVHILIIPNKHLGSVNDANREDEPALGRLITVAKELANQEGIEHNGYRLIVNTGSHGGQVVSHLHMHLIGGRRMQHPIG